MRKLTMIMIYLFIFVLSNSKVSFAEFRVGFDCNIPNNEIRATEKVCVLKDDFSKEHQEELIKEKKSEIGVKVAGCMENNPDYIIKKIEIKPPDQFKSPGKEEDMYICDTISIKYFLEEKPGKKTTLIVGVDQSLRDSKAGWGPASEYLIRRIAGKAGWVYMTIDIPQDKAVEALLNRKIDVYVPYIWNNFEAERNIVEFSISYLVLNVSDEGVDNKQIFVALARTEKHIKIINEIIDEEYIDIVFLGLFGLQTEKSKPFISLKKTKHHIP